MRRAMVGLSAGGLLAIMACSAAAQAAAEAGPAAPGTITVRGQGRALAAPDEAVIEMGAVTQADRADLAQSQVNQIVTRAITSITGLGVPAGRIQTSGISLSPVYSGTAPAPSVGATGGVVQEPRVIGYRASNVLRIEIDNLRVLGQVIDQAVLAGANQLHDLNFDVRDDRSLRREAITRATSDARLKAEAIAAALGVRILSVRQVEEAGVALVRPEVQYRQVASAAREAIAATPVQPGQVRVDAEVNVTYLIGPAPATQSSE